MRSHKCRYSPVTPSRSNPDVTCTQWTTWSWPTNQKWQRGQDQSYGLGQRNHRLVPPREQGGYSSSGVGTQEQVQWWVWCHHPPGPTESPSNSRPSLGFHFSSCHDWSSYLHFRHGFLHLETLLSSQRNSNTNNFSPTNADVSYHSTTSSRTRTCPETSQQHLSCTRQQNYSHRHPHHLGNIKAHQRRTPKKGRDIRNDMFVNSVKTLLNECQALSWAMLN